MDSWVESTHVNITVVHVNHILRDADAAWGLVHCCEDNLLDPHQQMKSWLVKPRHQLRGEEIENLKELTSQVLLWILPIMRCITVIIKAWSTSPWRECGPLD